MAAKKEEGGRLRLKKDLSSGSFAPCYVLYGEETYLRQTYLDELRKKAVDAAFADFNLLEYEGKSLSPALLQQAIDSPPAMSDRKLVIVHDLSLYQLSAEWAEAMPAILSDLPDFVCLVFCYDTIEFSQDKRLKIHKTLEKYAIFCEFARLSEIQLIEFIEREAKRNRVSISQEGARQLLFTCGTDMLRLQSELQKAACYTTLGEITPAIVKTVCSPTLEAVVFDLTDAVAAGDFAKAISLVEVLLLQKNTEIAIFAAITAHLTRLYGLKLCVQNRLGTEAEKQAAGSHSSYYIGKLKSSAMRVSLGFLRRAAAICAQTDSELKSSALPQQKQIELALLQMAAALQEDSA